MTQLAFLGLGVMGYPMAGHLLKAGHDVTVYNRTIAKAENIKKMSLFCQDAYILNKVIILNVFRIFKKVD